MRVFVVLLFLFAAQFCLAQTSVEKPSYPSLEKKAAEFNEATVKKNFDKVVDSTYPKLIEKTGGRGKTLDTVRQAVEEMKAIGFEVIAIKTKAIGDVQTIENEIFAVVPFVVTLKKNDGKKFVGEDYLVGVSSDGGKDWKFISGLDQEQMTALFPQVAAKLKLPELAELRPADEK